MVSPGTRISRLLSEGALSLFCPGCGQPLQLVEGTETRWDCPNPECWVWDLHRARNTRDELVVRIRPSLQFLEGPE